MRSEVGYGWYGLVLLVCTALTRVYSEPPVYTRHRTDGSSKKIK